MKNERVLVTGGAGYAGAVLVPMLLDKGYNVIVLDKMIHENSYNFLLSNQGGHNLLSNPNFKFFKGDIRDTGLIKKLITEVDSIIHLAAIVGEPAARRNKFETEDINVNGTKNIIDNLSKNQKIIFASTGSVYGQVDEMCLESTAPNPLGIYGNTKLQAEQMVLNYGGTAYRFATAFGLSPRLRIDLLPNDFTNKLVNQRSIDLYEVNARRTFIHVTDMARSYLFALENYKNMQGEPYNLGNESMNLTKIDLARKISKEIKGILGFEPRIWENEGEKDPDQRDYEVSYKKIQSINKGFYTEVGLEKGIQELVRFFSNFQQKNPFTNA
ncbi:MAG: NAD(P)-dependent oxidoreductase [Candidatus Pacearchaeota archaeon]|jgi:nucleoside-diphosphate-sugar epimerase